MLILDSFGIPVTRVKDGVTSSFITYSDIQWPSIHAAMGQQQAIADAPGDWYYYAGQTGLTRLNKKTGMEGEPIASMVQVFPPERGSVYTLEQRGVFDDGFGRFDVAAQRLFQSLRGMVVDAAGNAYGQRRAGSPGAHGAGRRPWRPASRRAWSRWPGLGPGHCGRQ